MSIDKFGRSSKAQKRGIRGAKGEGYNLTPEGDYDIQYKKLRNVADSTEDCDAVNLKMTKKLCLTLNEETSKYDAYNKQINNLGPPTHANDCATKTYVDNSCRNTTDPLTKNVAKHQVDIDSVKTRLAKCEGQIADNKTYHDKNLKKFGVLLFNYIHTKHTGKAVTLPMAREDDYLNWDVLFKIPEIKKTTEGAEIEIPIDDEARDYIMRKRKEPQLVEI